MIDKELMIEKYPNHAWSVIPEEYFDKYDEFSLLKLYRDKLIESIETTNYNIQKQEDIQDFIYLVGQFKLVLKEINEVEENMIDEWIEIITQEKENN